MGQTGLELRSSISQPLQHMTHSAIICCFTMNLNVLIKMTYSLVFFCLSFQSCVLETNSCLYSKLYLNACECFYLAFITTSSFFSRYTVSMNIGARMAGLSFSTLCRQHWIALFIKVRIHALNKNESQSHRLSLMAQIEPLDTASATLSLHKWLALEFRHNIQILKWREQMTLKKQEYILKGIQEIW